MSCPPLRHLFFSFVWWPLSSPSPFPHSSPLAYILFSSPTQKNPISLALFHNLSSFPHFLLSSPLLSSPPFPSLLLSSSPLASPTPLLSSPPPLLSPSSLHLSFTISRICFR